MTAWRQIHDTLEREIQTGRLADGAQLPVEAELAARFGVNRHTVRRAISALATRGIVSVEQGRGTFVRQSPIHWHVDKRMRFTEMHAQANRKATRRLLRAAEVAADAAIADALELKPGSHCYYLETLEEVDGTPLSVASRFFPGRLVPNLIDVYIAAGTITAALERLGIADYQRRSTAVSARLPSAEEAALLLQPREQPVLVIETVNVDKAGRPIEYGIARSAAARLKLTFDM